MYVCFATDEILLEAHQGIRAASSTASIDLKAADQLRLHSDRDISLCATRDLLASTIDDDIVAHASHDLTLVADRTTHLTAEKISLVASDTLELRVGGTSIVLKPGSIEIKSPVITSTAVGEHTISGALIRLN